MDLIQVCFYPQPTTVYNNKEFCIQAIYLNAKYLWQEWDS